MEQKRRLVLVLDPDVYRALDEQARAEERDPVQQARLIIRRAVEPHAAPSEAVPA